MTATHSHTAEHVRWQGSVVHSLLSIVNGQVRTACGIHRNLDDVDLLPAAPDWSSQCCNCRARDDSDFGDSADVTKHQTPNTKHQTQP